MKSNNYVNIQGWMVTQLELKGNELITYAIIYGFSQDGKNEFTGSIAYIAKWLNVSKRTVIRTLNELTDKNLILKTQEEVNNVTFNKYRVNMTSAGSFGGSDKMLPPVTKCNRGSDKMLPGGSDKMLPGGSDKTSPNNNTINNNRNNDDDVYRNIDILKDAYLEDSKILSSLIRQNTFKDKTAVGKRLDQFNDFLTSRGQHSKTWKDYTSHFLNWHKKNKKPVSKSPTDVTL
jgi:DNA-binding Lrp family transcriptional regulator